MRQNWSKLYRLLKIVWDSFNSRLKMTLQGSYLYVMGINFCCKSASCPSREKGHFCSVRPFCVETLHVVLTRGADKRLNVFCRTNSTVHPDPPDSTWHHSTMGYTSKNFPLLANFVSTKPLGNKTSNEASVKWINEIRVFNELFIGRCKTLSMK